MDHMRTGSMLLGLLTLGLFLPQVVVANEKAIIPNLSQIGDARAWTVIGRKAILLEVDGKKSIRFDEQAGNGVAWVQGLDVGDCTIEFDVRGKNVDHHSFIGVAFYPINQNTHAPV